VLHSTELFAHLQQYRPVSVEAVLRGSRDGSSVHPAVLALGLRYGDGSITGSTARCVALVHALCQVG
jgi:translation initiation factor eIF-2B subunit delta